MRFVEFLVHETASKERELKESEDRAVSMGGHSPFEGDGPQDESIRVLRAEIKLLKRLYKIFEALND